MKGQGSAWHPNVMNTVMSLYKLNPIFCRFKTSPAPTVPVHYIFIPFSTPVPQSWPLSYLQLKLLENTELEGDCQQSASPCSPSSSRPFRQRFPAAGPNPIDPMNQWRMSYFMVWNSNFSIFSVSEVNKTCCLSFETTRPGSLAEQNAHRGSTRTATHCTGARLIRLTELSLFHDPVVLHTFFVNDIKNSNTPNVKRAVPGSSLAEGK